MDEVARLDVTMDSLASRSGYDLSHIREHLRKCSEDSFVLDCVEIALDLPKWNA